MFGKAPSTTSPLGFMVGKASHRGSAHGAETVLKGIRLFSTFHLRICRLNGVAFCPAEEAAEPGSTGHPAAPPSSSFHPLSAPRPSLLRLVSATCRYGAVIFSLVYIINLIFLALHKISSTNMWRKNLTAGILSEQFCTCS